MKKEKKEKCHKMISEIKKEQEGNSLAILLRFNKRVQQSGILKEMKKRMFKTRNVSREKKRREALYRIRATEEYYKKLKKMERLP